ncbi:MAG: Acyl-CoA dehydrogenase [Variovorax sp.]|nr:Acyl-CoA dehydrogenase [Variovorax sp.]
MCRLQLDHITLAHDARTIRREIARTASQRDIDAALPVDAIDRIRKAGLGALRVPKEYGGAGLGFEALADAVLQLAAGDASVAQSLQPHFIFLERVRLMGDEPQRRRYLGAAAEGAFFGNAISEVGGGSGEWRTVLTRQGSSWRLDGSKFYATGTALADYTFVGALDPEGRRLLAVVPVTRQGVELGDDWRTMGQRATASGTARFSGVAVAQDELIALAPWEQRRHHTGAGSQIIHCAIDAGIAAAALDDALLHAQTKARPSRDSGHARVVDDPVVHHVVGEIAAAAFAAEAAVLLAARALDAAANALYASHLSEQANTPEVDALLVDASIAVANAKIVSSRAALLASEKLFEVGGASAAASALNLDRHWRNARTHTLHDPLAHKFRVIGDHLLSGKAPPNTFTY